MTVENVTVLFNHCEYLISILKFDNNLYATIDINIIRRLLRNMIDLQYSNLNLQF